MFDQCLYFNTSALARLLERLWSDAFRSFELTPPQGFLLRAVLDSPGLSQRELAELMRIARPTATRALDGLEAKRLIERRMSPADAREQLVFPTRSAETIKTALNAASANLTKQLKQQLGKDTFERTVERIRNLRSALE
ncbi:MAG TPA: MarR family winged helix-turn-helix transcriptional regulator [Polyangiales bacterium]|nr:MarR family winged helix-turn-helix transcriptional regulator [Polyangiales bacterium]